VRLSFFLAVLISAAVFPVSQAQLRIVDCNTSGARTGLNTVLAAIGVESVNGIAKPIDVLSSQQQATNGADDRL